MPGSVVHCEKEQYDVYIGRAFRGHPDSPWGNPFRIGPDGSRQEVIEKYRAYILGRKDLLLRLPELRNRVLGCWCKPKACHGDVLVEMVGE